VSIRYDPQQSVAAVETNSASPKAAATPEAANSAPARAPETAAITALCTVGTAWSTVAAVIAPTEAREPTEAATATRVAC
jgi:hypothetical protein